MKMLRTFVCLLTVVLLGCHTPFSKNNTVKMFKSGEVQINVENTPVLELIKQLEKQNNEKACGYTFEIRFLGNWLGEYYRPEDPDADLFLPNVKWKLVPCMPRVTICEKKLTLKELFVIINKQVRNMRFVFIEKHIYITALHPDG